MKKAILFIVSSLFLALTSSSQNIETETLYPFHQSAIEGGLHQISFDDINIPLYTKAESTVKEIKKAIKHRLPLQVTYNDSSLDIISVGVVTLNAQEKFLDKFDTLSYIQFTYNPAKSLRFNQNHLFNQFDANISSLQNRIPLDSVKILFNYFQDMSCTEVPTCSKEPACITFDYKNNGCNARAHWMKKILEEQFNYSCKKIFSEGSLMAINQGNCGGNCISWVWHVAPIVEAVDLAGNTSEYVLDPSLFTQPVSKKEWLAAQESVCPSTGKKGKVTKVHIESAETYTPNGSTDINYKSTKKLLYKFCNKCH